MGLLIRLLISLWLFGRIFLGYMLHFGFARLLTGRWFPGRTSSAQGSVEKRGVRWLATRRARLDEKNAERLLTGMLRLRGVYIKMGQVLSIMGGFLPRVYTKKLELLQDAVPPRPFEEIEKALVQSFGRSAQECFAEITPVPIAAASLGQVHAARLDDGRKVAVKVLYPGIRDVIRVDMKVVRLALRVYQRFVPVQNLEAVHEALVKLLRRETDYIHEGECMSRMAGDFASEPDIVFPEVVSPLTTKDVLTMTFMDGIKITRFEELAEAGVDRKVVGKRLVQCFYKQLFVHRLFHADPHPGNFLVQPGDTPGEPRIVVLDFGAVSEAPSRLIDGLVSVLRGFFEQKDSLVLQGVHQIGFVAPEGDRELLEHTVKNYFSKLLRVENRSVGALMRAPVEELEALADPEVERQKLRTLMKSVRYPEDWFYVERAVILMFWLIGQIDPELDTLQVGFPYVMPLLAKATAASSSTSKAV